MLALQPDLDAKMMLIKGDDVVIIGDGPMAYIAAIRLLQKKVKVTLVAPNASEFTRSHDVNSKVWEIINQAIAPAKITETPNRHLKDIEQQLHALVIELGGNILKQEFVDFDKKRGLILQDKKKSETTRIDADIVFDCTGTKRAAVTQYKNTKGERFSLASTGQKPARLFASMRTIMEKKDASSFESENYTSVKPIPFVLAMNKLKSFGWDRFNIPECHRKIFTKKNSAKVKSFLYMQLPEKKEGVKIEYKKDNLLQYANILLNLFNNTTTKDYSIELQETKKSNKRMFSTFTIDPKYIKQPYLLGDEDNPFCIHLGDATGDIPFVLGRSLAAGVARLIETLDTLIIQNGKIVAVNAEKLDHLYPQQIEKLKQEVNKYYEHVANEEKFLDPQTLDKIYSVAEKDKKILDEKDHEKIKESLKLIRQKK